tara:strand:+ start:366 stop:1385 length:1020 start_codon:yes stop_codon:yes gene_type:complete
MGLKYKSHSANEFIVGVQAQTAYGQSIKSGMTRLDVDSISFPSLNPIQVLDMKAGSGYMVQSKDIFQTNKLTSTEISFSGTLKESYADLFLENILNGESSGVHTLNSNFTPAVIGAGDVDDEETVDATDNLVLTFAIESPNSASTMLLKDCVVTSLTISGDLGTEAGRLKYSVTAKTGSVQSELSEADGTISALGTDDAFMTEAADSQFRIMHGVANVIPQSFSLNIENDAIFIGYDANGNAQAVTRAPEMSVTTDMSVKYDGNTEALISTFQSQTGSSSVAETKLANVATPANDTFGYKIHQGILTNVAFNEGDIMMLDCSVKAVGNDSNGAVLTVAL